MVGAGQRGLGGDPADEVIQICLPFQHSSRLHNDGVAAGLHHKQAGNWPLLQ